MQKILRDEYAGDVHVSTGMTTKDEIEQIVSFWEEGKGDAKHRLVLYNCTSGYPVPFEDVCLLELRDLYDRYAHRVKHLGFSGHHLGIAIDGTRSARRGTAALHEGPHVERNRSRRVLEPAGLRSSAVT